ncbi:MAG: iron-containing alcohol dehydrogenase [Alphaproteobacteria bacterium]|jgi:alcohol dehydrogenase class IV|nr:iron-containing alcohol dehydrogenase [Alphaproteobacteria bacterium]MBT7942224.1 iron-containing alcohol dehydrogenase [Alphaproteobacteria bacterium]
MTDSPALSGNWNYPTTIRFGVGRIKELSKCCKNLGMSRPLLVTDPGLSDRDMVLDAIASATTDGLPTGLFSDIKPNPVGQNISDGLRVFHEGGHDGVIAFGGGSAMDAGKTIAFMAGQKRPIWDFEDVGDNWKRAELDAIAPIVAVPTTSGTGSEVGRATVVIDEGSETKKILFHPRMLPELVICDPQLVTGLPPHLTAATGMDALAHCLEAYCVNGYHPMADGIALEGLRLVRNWLPGAVDDGQNLEARAHMMAAATMGATAFQKGLGAIHSLSHPVGAVFDTHHGLTNAVFMPYVMAFNRRAIEGKMERLARFIGLEDPSFEAVLNWVLDLRDQFDMPTTATELGVTEDRVTDISRMAAKDPTAPTNPISVGETEMREILDSAMEGRLG